MKTGGEDPFYTGFAISGTKRRRFSFLTRTCASVLCAHHNYSPSFSTVYQNSGDENSNWGEFEKRRNLFGRSVIRGGDRCGASCDFWHLYEDDIERAASLGSNCFRVSLEWSRLQPAGPGTAFDPNAIATYHRILDVLEAKGMEPFLTLHHFVHPLWFEKMKGFEKRENIPLFVEYSVQAFKEFGGRARFWATFNEPGVTSFAGFVHAGFPPGYLGRISGCGRHILHMLMAHTAAYSAIKALPGGKVASIGLVHNWCWFEPNESCCTPFYMPIIANVLNKIWGNDVVMNYLKTGIFDYNPLWGWGRVHYENPGGAPGCDHIGLNYYSRGLFDWKLQACPNPGEIMTDMPYALYPEGLLVALKGVSTLGIPIYITETGVADKGDSIRPQMIQSYMATIEKAVEMGYDLRGVMYWTLVDNFEWSMGFHMRFGVYSREPVPPENQKRQAHQSAALLAEWYSRLKERCPVLRLEAAAGAKGKMKGAEEERMDKEPALVAA